MNLSQEEGTSKVPFKDLGNREKMRKVLTRDSRCQTNSFAVGVARNACEDARRGTELLYVLDLASSLAAGHSAAWSMERRQRLKKDRLSCRGGAQVAQQQSCRTNTKSDSCGATQHLDCSVGGEWRRASRIKLPGANENGSGPRECSVTSCATRARQICRGRVPQEVCKVEMAACKGVRDWNGSSIDVLKL